MIKQILSRVGLGAPSIEMVLPDPDVVRGETLHGEIRVKGGAVALHIQELRLELQTYYHQQSGPDDQAPHGYVHRLRQQSVCEDFMLAARSTTTFGFELFVPMVTPVSQDLAQVWLTSVLDVAWAADPRDHDPVRILPDAATAHLLAAVLGLGFEHLPESGECLKLSQDTDLPFTQVFSFRSRGSLGYRLGKRIKRLDLLVSANHYDAVIQLEIDRNEKLVADWLPEDTRQADRRLRFRLRHNEPIPVSGLEDLLLRLLDGTRISGNLPWR